MGFYLRKSISAGPFRFNLSGSGLGLSVGVKGFRVGTGPRGNYVHMGRSGIYYRASLGGARQAARGTERFTPPSLSSPGDVGSIIETGNVLDMKPTSGSHILKQINEKMALMPLWPWALIGGGILSVIAFSQTNGLMIGVFLACLTLVLSVYLAFRDQQRRTVVIMYDIDDDIIAPFRKFTEGFDELRSVNQIWNVDSTDHTTDWKRNAGAGHLLSRKSARLIYSVPRVIKTNISVPAIIGGRQNIYFFPDIVLIVEGVHVGALSYEQLEVLWSTTVFIENGNVPSDAKIVGYTWQFVNKKGGPDRRFNNNRQLPKALYLQMGLSSQEGLRKMLHLSRVVDHAEFDIALEDLRDTVKKLSPLAFDEPNSSTLSATYLSAHNIFIITDEAKRVEDENPRFWEHKLTAILLRDNMNTIIERSKKLNDHDTHRKIIEHITSPSVALKWCQARLTEILKIINGLPMLLNDRLVASWGPPGQPGNANEIKQVCEDFITCVREILAWKECILLTSLPHVFSDLQATLSKLSDSYFEQIRRIPDELEQIIGQENPSGTHNIQLVFSTPENWNEEFDVALKRVKQSMGLD